MPPTEATTRELAGPRHYVFRAPGLRGSPVIASTSGPDGFSHTILDWVTSTGEPVRKEWTNERAAQWLFDFCEPAHGSADPLRECVRALLLLALTPDQTREALIRGDGGEDRYLAVTESELAELWTLVGSPTTLG